MWKSILFGALGLAVFETILTTSHNNRLSDLLNVPGKWARAFMDANTPLIPNYSNDTQPTKAQLGIPSSTPIAQTTTPQTTAPVVTPVTTTI